MEKPHFFPLNTCPYHPKWDPKNLVHTACSQIICWAFTETRSKAEAALGMPMDAQTKPGWSPLLAIVTIGWAFFSWKIWGRHPKRKQRCSWKKSLQLGRVSVGHQIFHTRLAVLLEDRQNNHQFFEVGKTYGHSGHESCWRITYRSTNGASWRFS